MKTLNVKVENLNDSLNRFKEVFSEAMTGNVEKTENYIAFSSIESFCNFLKLLDDLQKGKNKNFKLLEKLGILNKSSKNTVPEILYDQINVKIKL